MKKIYSFVLMATMLLIGTNAWGETRTAGTYDALQDAIAASAAGDVIELTADIDYPKNGEGLIDITKNITIDGKGHTLSGYGYLETGAYPAIAVNKASQSNETELTLKNLTISNPCKTAAYYCRVIQLEGHVKALTLDNVHIIAPNGSSKNARGIQIDGNDTGWDKKTKITIKNSSFNMGYSSYCITSYNPYELDAKNSRFDAWNVLTMKDVNSGAGHETAGSRGSVITFEACDLQTINPHTGKSNDYEIFSIQDDGITINLINCTTNAVQLKDQSQFVFDLNGWQMYPERREQPVVITISGDNSNIQGKLTNNEWAQGICYRRTPEQSDDYLPKPGFAYTITIKGGTYGFDPESYDEVVIPAGYEIKEIKTYQGADSTTLYRVREIIDTDYGTEIENPDHHTVSYTINADVEAEGEGQNANTEFKISADETVNVPSNSVIANYVEVSNNATLTVPEGTQLEVTNGLDVTGGAKVVIEAGSTVVVGEGGVTSENVNSIVITADENGSASFLLNPEVIINTTPNITVKMTAKQIGKKGNDYYWHRFAMPVAAGITSWEKEGSLVGTTYPTYLYGWDYENNQWLKLPNGVADMVPLQGYTLTLASEKIDPQPAELQDVTYIFKGNLVGNTNQPLNFKAEGFNFFGNSYTGYMDVLTLIQGLASDKVEGTVYMWCNDPDDDEERYQSYEGVSLLSLQNPTLRAFLADWQKEVAPMQTFILRLRGADSADESISYADAIWGNPRYGNGGAAPAPRRRVAAANNIESHMAIVVKAANSKGSRVEFTQDANNSDAFENGYDVVKYMNENAINLYATVEGEDLSAVVTDNIEGKTLSLKTNNEIAYTMSFKNVIGDEYALLDKATNQVIAIEEGTSYEFAAQPNSTIEGRFEIIGRSNAPTAIENTDVKANVKGIYTIMGQYLGEDFNALPAGVYVVDGVKIVK